MLLEFSSRLHSWTFPKMSLVVHSTRSFIYDFPRYFTNDFVQEILQEFFHARISSSSSKITPADFLRRLLHKFLHEILQEFLHWILKVFFESFHQDFFVDTFKDLFSNIIIFSQTSLVPLGTYTWISYTIYLGITSKILYKLLCDFLQKLLKRFFEYSSKRFWRNFCNNIQTNLIKSLEDLHKRFLRGFLSWSLYQFPKGISKVFLQEYF